MCPRSQYICRLNHSPQSQMLWNTTSFYVLNQLSFDSMPVPAWNSTVISIVSIVTTYTRDPSVARKMGEEAVLSGGPCWSPLLLSKLAAVRWSPVFLHLHATCGYGNAYQGRKPHTWAPTPTVMRLDVMMTARKHTIHAVISARNMRAILELTFHLFLIIVSFFLSNHCFLFPDCFSILLHFCLYCPWVFHSFHHTVYFLDLLFPRNTSPSLPVPSCTHSVGLPHVHHSGILFFAPLNSIHCFLVVSLSLDLISHIAGACTQITV